MNKTIVSDTLCAAAAVERGNAAACIHAPKAKAEFLKRADALDLAAGDAHQLEALRDRGAALNEIVEGVRNERWAAGGRRLKDTPKWCEFYVRLSAITNP